MGSTKYIGITARTEIKMNKVIMAVPRTLIISIDKAFKSEIGFIFKEYPIFQGEDNDDKDFNILALYLILEKMKGKKSFFEPYLNCVDLA